MDNNSAVETTAQEPRCALLCQLKSLQTTPLHQKANQFFLYHQVCAGVYDVSPPSNELLLAYLLQGSPSNHFFRFLLDTYPKNNAYAPQVITAIQALLQIIATFSLKQQSELRQWNILPPPDLGVYHANMLNTLMNSDLLPYFWPLLDSYPAADLKCRLIAKYQAEFANNPQQFAQALSSLRQDGQFYDVYNQRVSTSPTLNDPLATEIILFHLGYLCRNEPVHSAMKQSLQHLSLALENMRAHETSSVDRSRFACRAWLEMQALKTSLNSSTILKTWNDYLQHQIRALEIPTPDNRLRYDEAMNILRPLRGTSQHPFLNNVFKKLYQCKNDGSENTQMAWMQTCDAPGETPLFLAMDEPAIFKSLLFYTRFFTPDARHDLLCLHDAKNQTIKDRLSATATDTLAQEMMFVDGKTIAQLLKTSKTLLWNTKTIFEGSLLNTYADFLPDTAQRFIPYYNQITPLYHRLQHTPLSPDEEVLIRQQILVIIQQYSVAKTRTHTQKFINLNAERIKELVSLPPVPPKAKAPQAEIFVRQASEQELAIAQALSNIQPYLNPTSNLAKRLKLPFSPPSHMDANELSHLWDNTQFQLLGQRYLLSSNVLMQDVSTLVLSLPTHLQRSWILEKNWLLNCTTKEQFTLIYAQLKTLPDLNDNLKLAFMEGHLLQKIIQKDGIDENDRNELITWYIDNIPREDQIHLFSTPEFIRACLQYWTSHPITQDPHVLMTLLQQLQQAPYATQIQFLEHAPLINALFAHQESATSAMRIITTLPLDHQAAISAKILCFNPVSLDLKTKLTLLKLTRTLFLLQQAFEHQYSLLQANTWGLVQQNLDALALYGKTLTFIQESYEHPDEHYPQKCQTFLDEIGSYSHLKEFIDIERFVLDLRQKPPRETQTVHFHFVDPEPQIKLFVQKLQTLQNLSNDAEKKKIIGRLITHVEHLPAADKNLSGLIRLLEHLKSDLSPHLNSHFFSRSETPFKLRQLIDKTLRDLYTIEPTTSLRGPHSS